MVARNPSLRIPDRNHVAMYAAICVNLARESQNSDDQTYYLNIAQTIVAHMRADEMDGALARLLADSLALSGKFKDAEMWYDRALQAVDIKPDDRLMAIMYMGQVNEVQFLQQRRAGRTHIGDFIYEATEAELWYNHLVVEAQDTPIKNGTEYRRADFLQQAAPFQRQCT